MSEQPDGTKEEDWKMVTVFFFFIGKKRFTAKKAVKFAIMV